MCRSNIDENVKFGNDRQQLCNKLYLGIQDGLAIDALSTIRPVLYVKFCKKYTILKKVMI